jgi:hypothetical protein
MLFQTVQLFYWLSLSTWFGSVLFIALAAPIIFRTVRENNPILSHVLSVNLDGQHSTLLAGTIVFKLFARLLQVELICGCMLLVSFILQSFIIDLHGDNGLATIIRGSLFVLAMGAVFVDWRFVWPKIRSSRSEYLDHADEPEVANPARDRFDREQRNSLNLLTLVIVLLTGMILFSSSIIPVRTFTQIEPTLKAAK